ncbi:MAG: hypothetical protein HUK26_08480 [Duodenibacillus sp.]|nr:hypothetical protein [Duodenibacillus sp.]
MDCAEKIDLILSWADDVPAFDTGYVESLKDFLDDRGWLTDAQEEALDNIIDRWHIPVWD